MAIDKKDGGGRETSARTGANLGAETQGRPSVQDYATLQQVDADFDDGEETDVPYDTLLRLAGLGLLEVDRFVVSKKGSELLKAGLQSSAEYPALAIEDVMRSVKTFPLRTYSAAAAWPWELHQDTCELVVSFAAALAHKLAEAEKKYGYSNGWRSPDWMDECRANLLEHVAKGDPRDVAAYCAFLWYHRESTAITAAATAGSIAAHDGDVRPSGGVAR